MADIALVHDGAGAFDLALDATGLDLLRDDGLESAVILSLFADARASAEQAAAYGDPLDVRGWWGDYAPTVDGDATGSLLWLLRREKQTTETLARARGWAESALRWLTDDRVASRVTVATSYQARGVLRLDVDILRPAGGRVQYRYDYEWQAQAAKVGS